MLTGLYRGINRGEGRWPAGRRGHARGGGGGIHWRRDRELHRSSRRHLDVQRVSRACITVSQDRGGSRDTPRWGPLDAEAITDTAGAGAAHGNPRRNGLTPGHATPNHATPRVSTLIHAPQRHAHVTPRQATSRQ